MKTDERPIKIAARLSLIENVVRTMNSIQGRDPDYFKVFSVGFNKTGTTSMYSLFRSLGFEAMDGPHWRSSSKWHIHYQFQTFTDGPPENFRYLDATFPNSKFILNVRRLDEWLDSRIEHVRHRMQEPTYNAKWAGSKLPTVDVLKRWIRKRDEHHHDVLKYFQSRKDALLVVNYIDDQDASKRIAGFVGRDLGGSEKPYTRSTPVTRKKGELRNREMIEQAFCDLGIAPDCFESELLSSHSTPAADLWSKFCY